MSAIAVAGRFTKDGEIRITPNGHHILNFGIAENIRINGQEQAQFFNCQLFGNRAEKLAPYIKKGGAATVFGSLQIRQYTDRQGIERQGIDIIVGDITLQGSRDQAHASQPATHPAAARQSAPVEDLDSSEIPF
ncbi:hypothetical protein A7Q03_08770 [Eikenella sp. NML99-0057]|uniref:single-stranded DNA-binding protein n=1 Tax=Eikenella sp. NML99-0057 TaxID=1795834 RepID=UPI0007E1C85E|nr:single-stranded DNA-binding protein [Eikenella sp. NML99-0057]OAM44446.1 hypothetical protein A7Q03_08770 [Eikenella sp. NML99-0057]